MLAQFLLLSLLIACSFFVSGSETALFALTSRQLRSFSNSENVFKRRAYLLMRHPQRVLMTVLLANTALNIAIFAVSYSGASQLGPANPLVAALGGIITLLLVLLFGEVIPKALALAHAARIAPISAPVIQFLEVVSTPIRVVLQSVMVEPMIRLFAPSEPDADAADDLRTLVEMSAHQGIISSRENDMLQAVFVLPEMLVRSVMVPRVSVKAIKLNVPRRQILQTFHETRLKQLPVIGRDMDDVRGTLKMRDLFLHPQKPIESHIQPTRFVPEVISLLQLIHHFRETKTRFAIVVDEHGGVSGLITLEDVVEQIVGDLVSSHRSEDEKPIEKIDERQYVASGQLGVRHWRRIMGDHPQLADVDTIGGVVSALLGRLPHEGDTVRVGRISITVIAMSGRSIGRVRLQIAHRDRETEAAI